MKAAVVILNWNGRNFLEKYLPFLVEFTPPEYGEIIVADNGSDDDSIEFLKKNYGNIRRIELSRNYGFTGGYNRAFSEINAEYFVLINSDIRVTEEWLKTILDFMDQRPDADICMPKILSELSPEYFEYAGACGGFIDRFGFPFCRGRILSEIEADKGQYDDPMEVFWASGACMVIKSGLYRELGGLDETFFAHMEEIDLCWRAKLIGAHVWVVPQSRVYHIGGGTLPNNSPHKLYLNYRNNLLMLHKNLPYRKNSKRAMLRRKSFICTRICIDNLSALIYLLQLKYPSFKAVIKAHSHFKKMKKSAPISPRLISYTNSSLRNLPGGYRGSIILKFITGRRQFSKLKLS